jgi:ATP-dependent helicase/nuclease subunit B
MLLAALHGRGRRSAAELAGRYPELAHGLTMLSATQAFDIVDRSYDARVGSRGVPETISVSALEQLGRCPLQFFFGNVLRVHELDDQADPFELEPRQVGVEIHTVLEHTLQTLTDEGLFDSTSADDAAARALELVERERPRILGDVGERLRRRLPVLGRQLEETWIRAVRTFVEWDVRRMVDHGWRPVETEEMAAREIDFGDGIVTTVRGRIDRRVAGADESRIGDYKTSGALDRRMSILNMLRGKALQVPLYWMISGETSSVELLGIGPQYDGVEDASPVFGGFDDDATRRGFRETLRVLLALPTAGSFPFNAGRHCEWCAYRAACRRNHPPTKDREALLDDATDYRLVIEKKTTQQPLLDQHRVTP